MYNTSYEGNDQGKTTDNHYNNLGIFHPQNIIFVKATEFMGVREKFSEERFIQNHRVFFIDFSKSETKTLT